MAAEASQRRPGVKAPVFLLVLGLVLVLSAEFVGGDIHRAKTHTGRAAPYQAGQQRAARDKAAADGGRSASAPAPDGDSSESQPPSEAVTLEAWTCALLATTLVGMTGIFPLLLPFSIDVGKNDESAARFKCLLSFAVGGLLGDVFLHLLPEAWSHISPEDHSGQMSIGVWVLCGIFAFLVLEKVFGEEEQKDADPRPQSTKTSASQNGSGRHSLPQTTLPSLTSNGNAVSQQSRTKPRKKRKAAAQENGRGKEGGRGVGNGTVPNGLHITNGHKTVSTEKQENKPHVKVTGYLNLLANFIDNFTHGLAVAGSFLVSNKVGLLTTAAILLHEIPHEIGDFAILLRSGFSRWQAAKAQVCTATGGLCGALLALMSESAEKAGDSAAWILPFTSGGFLNIALVTVLPDLLEETNPREGIKQVVCLLSGIAVMGAVNLIID